MAMSMRSRGAAAAARRSRSGVRPVYEDFKPASEFKHEEGVDIVLYHLPGFVKEQIRIIAESKGILRVQGERLIANNKWSRFEEEITVPQDCNLSQIRAKFENDTLKITMPKTVLKKENIQPKIIEKEANNNQVNDPSSSSMHEKKLHDEMTNFKSKEVGNEGIINSSTIVNKNDDESHHKLGHDEKDDFYNNENDEEKVKEKDGVFKKNNDDNEGYGLSNKLKNLSKTSHVVTRKLEEDRQLLMNMGAAILVIMALGASISFSIGLG